MIKSPLVIHDKMHYLCIQIRASAAGPFCYPRFTSRKSYNVHSVCPEIIPEPSYDTDAEAE